MGKKNPPIDFLKALSPPSRPGSPVANRQPSRSPQPYRRGPPPSPRVHHTPSPDRAAYLPSPALTPDASRAPSPLPRKCNYGGSESGTEADDELARKLPAPPRTRKRTSSEEGRLYEQEDDTFDGQADERGRRRRRLVGGGHEQGGGKKRNPRAIAFVRRGIEIGLMGILVGTVLCSRQGRIWKEVRIREPGKSSLSCRLDSKTARGVFSADMGIQSLLRGPLYSLQLWPCIHFQFCFGATP